MPTLRAPVTGSLVKTPGSVMYRPPSPGQHVRMGSVASDGRSVSTISWQGACATRRGAAFATSKSVASFFTRSMNVPGMRRSSRRVIRPARSSSRSTPSAHAMRSAAPNALTSTGMSWPSTRSKSSATFLSAGLFDTRSTISVISRSRETGTVTRRRRSRFSSNATSSDRSRNAIYSEWKSVTSQPASTGSANEARTRTLTKRQPIRGASQAMIRCRPKSDHAVM